MTDADEVMLYHWRRADSHPGGRDPRTGSCHPGRRLISLDAGEELSGLEKVAESEGDTDAEAGDELAGRRNAEGGEDSAASEEA